MKHKFYSLKLFLLLAALCMGAGDAFAWEWIGEDIQANSEFYLYNVGLGQFANATSDDPSSGD